MTKYLIKQNETGSIIVTVLVMLLMLSLGVGLTLMFNSSSIQTVENNIELRATNLAEGGYRYAAGEYIDAGSLADKFDRLEAMHQEEVTLLNNDGSFQLSVFPYWFVTNADVTDAATLNMRVVGKFPEGFQADLPASGMVNINGNFYSYNSGSATTGATDFDPDQFRISLTGGDTVSVDRNTGVYLAFAPYGTPNITEGGAFTIFPDSRFIDLLPKRNGVIELYLDEVTASGSYKYSQRQVLNDGAVRLTGIESIKDGALPISLGSNSRIVIKRQVVIESVGSIGSGSLTSMRGLSLNVFLTDEAFLAADSAKPLDLGGGGDSKHEIFDDEGTTVLDNWEFDNSANTLEKNLITTTTQEVSTVFDKGGESKANFLTFQNFSEEDQDHGYTMDVIDKSRIPSSVRDKNLNGIWGNASDNMYFVGDDGTILHFDGESITLKNIGFTVSEDLNAVWGLPSEKHSASETDKIFVVGDDGRALINEGSGWERSLHDQSYDLYAAHGTSWGHFDGYGESGTNPYNWDSPDTADQLSDYNWYINEFSKKINFRCLWAIDHRYPHSQNYGGGSSIKNNQNVMVGEFSSKGGSGNGKWNSGDGFVLHEFYLPAVRFPGTPLRGIWGSDWGNVYAVGDNGSIFHNTRGNSYNYGHGLARRLDHPYRTFSPSWQGGWVKETHLPTTENFNGVYGNNATDFYVIGDNGTILYNKGNGFELVPTNGVTSEDLNSIWGSDRTGIYAVGDNGTIVFLGYPVNKIGEHILPLDKNAEIAAKWATVQHYLSYTIQVKNVWGDDMEYAAPGICFRWHQAASGKYAGFGISFMRFDSSTNSYNDMIPDSIKPFFKGVKEQNDKLLIVLWEQYVQGGAEQRRWIAYKDISADAKMLKANGTPVDLSSLIVRVHEKKIEGRKVNDINVYYGNSSMTGQGQDNKYNNTKRNRYNATFGKKKNGIKWPVFDLDEWTGCIGNGCKVPDLFTLVDNVSVAQDPVPATTALKYWIVNPASDLVILKNGFTIRTSRFTSPSGASFGSQSQRSEIGLHVFGDIGRNGTQRMVSFTDFAVQLGVDAAAVNAESRFGSLQ